MRSKAWYPLSFVKILTFRPRRPILKPWKCSELTSKLLLAACFTDAVLLVKAIFSYFMHHQSPSFEFWRPKNGWVLKGTSSYFTNFLTWVCDVHFKFNSKHFSGDVQHVVQHHLVQLLHHLESSSGSHLFEEQFRTLGWKFTFGFFYNQFVGTTLAANLGTLTSK